MASRLSESRLGEIRLRAKVRDALPRPDVLLLLAHLDATEDELARLRAEAGNAEFWRAAFERLQRDLGRAREHAAGTRVGSS